MAGKLGSLNINLALDSVQFSQGLERAQKSAVKFATTTNSNLNSIEQNVQRLTRSIQGADRLVKINLFAGIPVKKVLSFADEYTELGNRIKLVTKDQTEQAAAMRDPYISKPIRNRSGLHQISKCRRSARAHTKKHGKFNGNR